MIVLLSAAIALTGCSRLAKLNPFGGDKEAEVASGEFSGRGPIALETNPPGATVVTLGRMLGKTPLRVEEKDIFPTFYPKEMEPIYGKVRFKRKGCKDVIRQVTPEDIAAGIKIDLECGEAATKRIAQQPNDDVYDDTIGAPLYSGDNNVKVRLLRVKDLLEEGLITQEEAEEIRKRILADF